MAPNLDPRAYPGSFFVADLLAGIKSSHHVKDVPKYLGIWVGIFRNFRIFPKWKTATLVGQDSAWEVQKHYFLPKNIGFGIIFGHFPLYGGFPWVPLLAPIGPFVTPDIRPIGRC